jgi:hypothetical protein
MRISSLPEPPFELVGLPSPLDWAGLARGERELSGAFLGERELSGAIPGVERGDLPREREVSGGFGEDEPS